MKTFCALILAALAPAAHAGEIEDVRLDFQNSAAVIGFTAVPKPDGSVLYSRGDDPLALPPVPGVIAGRFNNQAEYQVAAEGFTSLRPVPVVAVARAGAPSFFVLSGALSGRSHARRLAVQAEEAANLRGARWAALDKGNARAVGEFLDAGSNDAFGFLKDLFDQASSRESPTQEEVDAGALPVGGSYFSPGRRKWLLRKAERARNSPPYARADAAWLYARLGSVLLRRQIPLQTRENVSKLFSALAEPWIALLDDDDSRLHAAYVLMNIPNSADYEDYSKQSDYLALSPAEQAAVRYAFNDIPAITRPERLPTAEPYVRERFLTGEAVGPIPE